MRTKLPKSDQKYPYVRLWCRFMGSYEYYAALMEEKAREANAPSDAVYEDRDSSGEPTGTWVRLSEIRNKSFVKACELWKEGKLKESDGWPNV